MLNSKKKILIACGFWILFLLLIILVKKVNVDAIGPEGTKIGLSGINRKFHDLTGFQPFWYKLTQILGYASLLLAAAFGFFGLMQLVKRKSLLKVDYVILALGGLYVVVLAMYALFEKVVISYRPVIMEGDAHVEASFPSSHTMLAIVVLGSAAIVEGDYITDKVLCKRIRIGLIAVCAVLVVGRFLSGAHWLTDILGGILISTALIFMFSGIHDILRTAEKQRRKKRKKKAEKTGKVEKAE